jgi:hypothetical protein
MAFPFEPRLDILPESQRLLWPELDSVPTNFVLYGGTALALQLGHRVSDDFDFFSPTGFEPRELHSRLPFFADLAPENPDVWVHWKPDNLEGFIDRGGIVKVAFFGGLDTLRRVEDPRPAAGSRVQVASLIDLAGMKMRVIQARASWKDYIDIHALALNGIDLPLALAAAMAIDRRFDPLHSIRALQFYGDGTLGRVPATIRADLTRWAASLDLAKLPTCAARGGLVPDKEENRP